MERRIAQRKLRYIAPRIAIAGLKGKARPHWAARDIQLTLSACRTLFPDVVPETRTVSSIFTRFDHNLTSFSYNNMATNPAEGPDTFSRVLPLPFRLELEIILGFWLWALNLHGFHTLNIDIFTLIRYPHRPTDDEPALHTSAYRLAGVLTGLWIGAITIFWSLTHGNAELVISHSWIPNLLFFLMLAVFLLPRYPFTRAAFGSPNSAGVTRLFQGLRRIAFGGIAKPKPEKFGDVLLADALTSYSKPISEVFVTLCMLLKGLGTTNTPDRLCGREIVVPLAIAWPFFIRFRQCLKEDQWANAVKYATAFPVIVLSSMTRKNPTLLIFWYVFLSIVCDVLTDRVTGDWQRSPTLSIVSGGMFPWIGISLSCRDTATSRLMDYANRECSGRQQSTTW